MVNFIARVMVLHTVECVRCMVVMCNFAVKSTKVNDLINPNFSLRFIANVCKQYVESEMTDRSTLVWEYYC